MKAQKMNASPRTAKRVDVETRLTDDHHQALKLWLRLLSCTNLVEAQIVFLDLEAAYTLKHDLRHIYRGRRYGAPRNDARAGMAITYPGVMFSPRKFG